MIQTPAVAEWSVYTLLLIIANLLIGVLIIAYYVSGRIYRNRQYVFKPVENVFSGLKTLALPTGLLFLICGIFYAVPQFQAIAPAVYLSIAILGWLFFLSIFNYGGSSSDTNVPEDIEEEILTRYTIEDKLIAKNKQLEWAERTAKICYGNWDVKGNIIEFSDGAENVLGVDAHELTSFEQLKSIIIPEDRIKIQRLVESATSAGEINSFLFRIIADGKLKYIQMNGEVYDSGTSINLIRGTFQNVTEQQMFIKRIEDKNEILKGIAWTQSHEVRGPLATIMGLISLLNEEDFANTENKEIIEGLKQAAEQLDDIIRKIVKKAESAEVDLS